jgi:predicted DsbA family dithiol-disulfide isomerase
LDADEVDAVLTGDAFAAEVRQDLDAARQIGISGVPFFVVDGRLGISGAQPPETLKDLLDQGWLTREPAPVQVVPGADDADACGPDGCEI